MSSISLPDQLFRTGRFTFGDPNQFAVALRGRAVLFLRSGAGDDPVHCLWLVDLDTGTERLLVDPAALGGDRAVGPGIGGYAVDKAGELAAFLVAGELWTVRVADGRTRRMPVQGPVTDPRPDPAGRRIAYVSEGAVRMLDADGTGDRALAAPDGPEVTFGIGEHTDTTSVDGPRGYWWAPDGNELLVARVDSAPVDIWYVADPTEPATPPRAVRYAAAGTANPEVTLWLIGLDAGGAGTEVRWDRGAFEYLVGAGWDEHGPYAVVQSRNQRIVRFLGVDPVSGETRVRNEQRDDCWVQLIPGLPARTSSGAVLAHVDEAGTRQLTVAGVAVTPAGLQVRAVVGVDGDAVFFTGSDEPTETHLWSYRPDEGLRKLSTEPGVHTGTCGNGTLVHVARCPDRPGVRVEVLRAGKPGVPIGSLVARPVLDVHRTSLVLGPRALRAALYLPSWHRPGDAPLPVLLDPYGGAGHQQVTAELAWHCLVSQWFAEQGFAVLVVDGVGTPGRGPDWEREVYGDLFGPVLDDQVAGLRAAGRLRPELDLGRVGIRGWSFGGSLAALAVLRRPEVFHAAVAGAGVTDQLRYDAHWRERFLGHPAEFPARYAASSLVTAALELTRPLLLMHGLLDENVFPSNTLLLSAALLAAGRQHEVLLLSGLGHRAFGTAGTANLLRHQLDFLHRQLRVEPGTRP
ncbi:MAG TPA: prolyl oligopeptidase family serine peptidase [Sporichthyaceae bacterium]|jgi:dipeptidyl-peptidase-4|nr:prolyl oligopeptidase family serine peptidase [Sporichthyaceae bacterium]